MDIRDSRTQRWLLGGFVGGGIVYALFFTILPFSYRTRSVRLAETREQYQTLSAELVKARQTIAELPKLERRFQELRETYRLARELLPDEKEIADLLRKVTMVGQRSGVEFELFKPQPPQASPYYSENPVDVTVRGGYHQVGAFLAEVANLSRIVNVANLRVDQLPQPESAKGHVVEASFLASAYTMGGAQPRSAMPVVGASTVSGAPVAAGGTRPPAVGPRSPARPVRVAEAAPAPAGGAQ